jgi:hypothetical protein
MVMLSGFKLNYMLAICFHHRRIVCKLPTQVHHRYTHTFALKRRRNNRGLGCFREEEHMSLVTTRAEMLALSTGEEPTEVAGMGRVR